MSIVQKIKDFLARFKKREEPKLLNEGNQNSNTERNEFIESLRVSKIAQNEPSIEDCICEFIKQYELREKNTSKEVNPYKVFIGMFCGEEEAGNNQKNQEKLSQYVKKTGFRIDYQYSGDKVSFMHISGKDGIDEQKNPNVEKLYINCERKNIALLTAEIFKSIKGIAGDKLQMKCVSEQLLNEQKEYENKQKFKNYQRNDKIVIYAENSIMADRIAEEINLIRDKKPDLFSTNKAVPFLPKKCGFLGIAKEKRGASVQTPLGYASGRTYNDYLSDIFYQSIVAGFDKEFGINSNNCKESPEERMKQYTSVFSDFSNEQRTSVLKNCKDIFLDVCTKGKVKTIYTKDIENERNTDDRLK